MASELFSKANDEYISENYQRAVELYSEALVGNPNSDDVLVNRAQAYLKLKLYKDALQDCDKALVLNSKNVKAYLRKGTALFNLKDYRKALDVFIEGLEFAEDRSAFDIWIEKCEANLTDDEKQKNEEGSSATASKSAAAAPSAPPPTPKKYDWYQTQTHVVVTLLKKNTKKEELVVEPTETTLRVHTKLANGEDFDLDLHLSHPIMPEQTVSKVMTSKVEIKLKKAEGVQWTKLEGDGQKFALKLPSAVAGAAADGAVSKYPSSSHYTRDWDKLEKEVKEEEKNENLEGDAALNKLFQQIYADGSDETRKAMMKSFSESGGTVLSTNWSEVGKEKVEVKPPDGMEFKKYQM